MTRSIIIFFICLFFLLLWPKNSPTIPVFLINSEPTAITKGQSGNAFIVAISFEHDELQSFIEQQAQLPITYLISTDLLDRSPALVQTLKRHQPIVGLLGSTTDQYEESPALLEKQLERFQIHFNEAPMYFMTEDKHYTQQLLNTLAKKQINAVAPSLLSSYSNKPKKGQILYVQFDESTVPNFNKLQAFLKKHKFSSIEETIFDASISTSTAP